MVQATASFWSVRNYLHHIEPRQQAPASWTAVRPLLIAMLIMMLGQPGADRPVGRVVRAAGRVRRVYEAIYHSAVNLRLARLRRHRHGHAMETARRAGGRERRADAGHDRAALMAILQHMIRVMRGAGGCGAGQASLNCRTAGWAPQGACEPPGRRRDRATTHHASRRAAWPCALNGATACMTKYSPPSQFPSYAKAPSAKSPWDESMASRASNENRPRPAARTTVELRIDAQAQDCQGAGPAGAANGAAARGQVDRVSARQQRMAPPAANSLDAVAVPEATARDSTRRLRYAATPLLRARRRRHREAGRNGTPRRARARADQFAGLVRRARRPRRLHESGARTCCAPASSCTR